MPNVPTITPGPDNTEHTPEGITETLPLITDVHADKESGRTNDTAEISDEEAYAKLKAKRAERRRKKLIRRGIAAGIVGVIALIAIVATLVINAQPQGQQRRQGARPGHAGAFEPRRGAIDELGT